MGKWKVELDTGKSYVVEAETQPTEQEVFDYLESSKPKEPVNPTVVAAASNPVATGTAALFASVGKMGLEAGGNFAKSGGVEELGKGMLNMAVPSTIPLTSEPTLEAIRNMSPEQKETATRRGLAAVSLAGYALPISWAVSFLSGPAVKAQHDIPKAGEEDKVKALDILAEFPKSIADHFTDMVTLADVAFQEEPVTERGRKLFREDNVLQSKDLGEVWGNVWTAYTGEKAPTWFKLATGITHTIGLSPLSPEFRGLFRKAAWATKVGVTSGTRETGAILKGVLKGIVKGGKALSKVTVRDALKNAGVTLRSGASKTLAKAMNYSASTLDDFIATLEKRALRKDFIKTYGKESYKGMKLLLDAIDELSVGGKRADYAALQLFKVNRPAFIRVFSRPDVVSPTLQKASEVVTKTAVKQTVSSTTKVVKGATKIGVKEVTYSFKQLVDLLVDSGVPKVQAKEMVEAHKAGSDVPAITKIVNTPVLTEEQRWLAEAAKIELTSKNKAVKGDIPTLKAVGALNKAMNGEKMTVAQRKIVGEVLKNTEDYLKMTLPQATAFNTEEEATQFEKLLRDDGFQAQKTKLKIGGEEYWSVMHEKLATPSSDANTTKRKAFDLDKAVAKKDYKTIIRGSNIKYPKDIAKNFTPEEMKKLRLFFKKEGTDIDKAVQELNTQYPELQLKNPEDLIRRALEGNVPASLDEGKLSEEYDEYVKQQEALESEKSEQPPTSEVSDTTTKKIVVRRYLNKEDVPFLKKEYKYKEGFQIKKIRGQPAYEITFPYDDHLEVKMFFEHIVSGKESPDQLATKAIEEATKAEEVKPEEVDTSFNFGANESDKDYAQRIAEELAKGKKVSLASTFKNPRIAQTVLKWVKQQVINEFSFQKRGENSYVSLQLASADFDEIVQNVFLYLMATPVKLETEVDSRMYNPSKGNYQNFVKSLIRSGLSEMRRHYSIPKNISGEFGTKKELGQLQMDYKRTKQLLEAEIVDKGGKPREVSDEEVFEEMRLAKATRNVLKRFKGKDVSEERLNKEIAKELKKTANEMDKYKKLKGFTSTASLDQTIGEEDTPLGNVVKDESIIDARTQTQKNIDGEGFDTPAKNTGWLNKKGFARVGKDKTKLTAEEERQIEIKGIDKPGKGKIYADFGINKEAWLQTLLRGILPLRIAVGFNDVASYFTKVIRDTMAGYSQERSYWEDAVDTGFKGLNEKTDDKIVIGFVQDKTPIDQIPARYTKAVIRVKAMMKQFREIAKKMGKDVDEWDQNPDFYFPHIFIGQWQVISNTGAEVEVGEGDAEEPVRGTTVGFARDIEEAKEIAQAHLKKNPKDDIVIRPRQIGDQQTATLLGRKAFWSFVQKIKKQTSLKKEDVLKLIKGVAGVKDRGKYVGNFQQRVSNLEGYLLSRNALKIYANRVLRKKWFDPLLKTAEAFYAQLPPALRHFMKERIEHVVGSFDPYDKGFHTSKLISKVTSTQAKLKLGYRLLTPAINLLQPMQTAFAEVGHYLFAAYSTLGTEEAKDILDWSGVSAQLPKYHIGEDGITKKAGILSPLGVFSASEMLNRKAVVWAGYKFARSILDKDLDWINSAKGKQFDYIYRYYADAVFASVDKYLDRFPKLKNIYDQDKTEAIRIIAAIEYALDLNADSNYLYDSSDIPQWFLNKGARIPAQFRVYPINFISQAGVWAAKAIKNPTPHNIARVTRFIAANLAIGGVRAIPYLGRKLWWFLMGTGVVMAMPKKLRQTVLRGVFSLLGVDFAAHVGAGEFIPRTTMDIIAGPSGRDLQNFWELAQGNIDMMEFFRRVAPAAQMATSIYKLATGQDGNVIIDPYNRKRTVVDATPWDKFLEGINFPVLKKNLAKDISYSWNEANKAVQQRKARIVDSLLMDRKYEDEYAEIIKNGAAVIDDIIIRKKDLVGEIKEKTSTTIERKADTISKDTRRIERKRTENFVDTYYR